ncbi:uncharacterized protein BYT42DRAFT_565962 [Radiomyces spectabilis]|uniref:uncharacterized protein n=1 Tax=Radiomyces spectabilis TaxID=64574 RepID=UPI00221EFCE2|nr:uncharacterized protein BYT42DRAFT_565962 [Radiomyces spectabilis]KAI8381279.1 hypothetical protein BYT42DRAFT_565962 [Radiomyces spectabilis]
MADRVRETFCRRPVALFTRTDCPKAIPALQLLKDTFGFEPEVLFLDHDPQGTEIESYLEQVYNVQRNGTSIFIESKYIGDYEAALKLKQSGEFDDM